MKLPDIAPAGPVPSPAGALERAGEAAGQAGREWSQYFLEERKAELTLQSQAAAVEVARAAHDTKQLIETQPYVPVAAAKELFGGQLPEGVEVTNQVLRNGKLETVEDPVVPMHKLAKPLYEQRMADAVENAARRIDSDRYREMFRQHAAATVEAKRGEILDWQKAQFLADAELRTLGHFNDAVRQENWQLAEAIATGAAPAQLSVATRNKLIQELPRMKAQSEILKSFDSSDPAAIAETMKQVRSGAYSKLFDAQEETAFIHAGSAQLKAIEDEQRRRKKEFEDAQEAKGLDIMVRAAASGRNVREVVPVSTIFSIPGITPDGKKRLLDYWRTGGETLDDYPTVQAFYEMYRNDVQGLPGPKLSDLPDETMLASRLRMSPAHWDQFNRERATFKERAGRVSETTKNAYAYIHSQLTASDDPYGFGGKGESAVFQSVAEIMFRLDPLLKEYGKENAPVPPAKLQQAIASYVKEQEPGLFGGAAGGKVLKDVPPAARAYINAALEAARTTGPPPTTQDIAAGWKAIGAMTGPMEKIYRKFYGDDSVFSKSDVALYGAMELNPQSRQAADAVVERWAARGFPLKGLTDQEKRFMVYISDPRLLSESVPPMVIQAIQAKTHKLNRKAINEAGAELPPDVVPLTPWDAKQKEIGEAIRQGIQGAQ